MKTALFLKRDHGTRLHFARRHRVSGCILTWFGAIVLSAGVSTMVEGGAWLIAAAFIGLLGLCLFLVGMSTFVWVDDVVLDAGSGTFRERRGVWPFARWTEAPLDLIDSAVRTVQRRAQGESSTYTARVVMLEFRDDRDPIVVEPVGGSVEANQLHERLAGFLGVVAVDRSGTRETRREPDELDLSLAERVARDREKRSGADAVERDSVPPELLQRVPLPPPGSDISLEETHQGVKITLPRLYHYLRFELIFTVSWSLATLWIWVYLARASILDLGMPLYKKLFLGLVALFFSYQAVRMLRYIFLPLVIEERGDRIHLSRSFGGRAVDRSELPKVAIEMVDRSDNSVRIRSDEEVHRMGAQLDPEALDWLEVAVTIMAVRREQDSAD